MKVRSKIHSRDERLQQRLLADRLCHRSLLRMLCVLSVLRTFVTVVLPLAGNAAWWLIVVLLLPGVIAVLLAEVCIRNTKCQTLQECVQSLMGKTGECVVSGLLSALLLIDGIATITTLVCFFTEGTNAEGTQITMTILTCAVLLWCLDQNGLPRGIWLLKWVMLGAGVIVGLDLLGKAQTDHLFPLLGNGTQSVMRAVGAGVSLSWPLLLLLTEPPVHKKSSHIAELVPPLLLIALCVLLLALAFPGEVVARTDNLAQTLLLPIKYLHSAVKMLMQCLLMLTMFLLIAAQAHTASRMSVLVSERARHILPHVFVILIGLTQLLPIKRLWSVVCVVERWMLLPIGLIVLALCSALFSQQRRRKA